MYSLHFRLHSSKDCTGRRGLLLNSCPLDVGKRNSGMVSSASSMQHTLSTDRTRYPRLEAWAESVMKDAIGIPSFPLA